MEEVLVTLNVKSVVRTRPRQYALHMRIPVLSTFDHWNKVQINDLCTALRCLTLTTRLNCSSLHLRWQK